MQKKKEKNSFFFWRGWKNEREIKKIHTHTHSVCDFIHGCIFLLRCVEVKKNRKIEKSSLQRVVVFVFIKKLKNNK